MIGQSVKAFSYYTRSTAIFKCVMSEAAYILDFKCKKAIMENLL